MSTPTRICRTSFRNLLSLLLLLGIVSRFAALGAPTPEPIPGCDFDTKTTTDISSNDCHGLKSGVLDVSVSLDAGAEGKGIVALGLNGEGEGTGQEKGGKKEDDGDSESDSESDSDGSDSDSDSESGDESSDDEA
ncbi:hypothetical protein PQX77_008846 [Marasmius sp. AFHP31]|nr:hypothetical protein PQX77_008846 [Marasmius sp. AFHP31]